MRARCSPRERGREPRPLARRSAPAAARLELEPHARGELAGRLLGERDDGELVDRRRARCAAARRRGGRASVVLPVPAPASTQRFCVERRCTIRVARGLVDGRRVTRSPRARAPSAPARVAAPCVAHPRLVRLRAAGQTPLNSHQSQCRLGRGAEDAGEDRLGERGEQRARSRSRASASSLAAEPLTAEAAARGRRRSTPPGRSRQSRSSSCGRAVQVERQLERAGRRRSACSRRRALARSCSR